MAKLRFSYTSLLLLQAVAALAAPNGSPTSAQPALRVPAASTLATVTAAPASSLVIQAELEQYQTDLKRRAISDLSLPGTASSAVVSIANSFTNDNNSSSANATSAATSTGPEVMATGMFTAADGGVYDVTSQNGYVVVDFKTLYPGQGALIGNEEVMEGSSGLVANGVTIALSTTTIVPVVTSSAAAATTSSEASSMATSSTSGSVVAAGSTVATIPASSASSAAAAAPTQHAGHALAAAAGGLVGLMLL